MQSLLCDYTTHILLPTLHEATRALGEVTDKAPTHLCDTWRWLALEGDLYVVKDLPVMLTTNGVLITVTADVKTSKGVQIITHCPMAMAPPLPLLAFAQTADAGNFHYGGTLSSGGYTAIRSGRGLGSCWASLKQIKCPSSGAPNFLN